ncbi:MAG: hypothetical protein CMF62_01815 [Magnetococcales bacterium]|nr:hypothetical protein [Magnetococcales bacterium]|tara:strand:- start:89804 stop:91723 length:1920 start_codon:yes stop_codon:yes gene_type:complete
MNKQLLKNPYEYANKISIKDLELLLRKLSINYYNTGKSDLTDEIFDMLKDVLKTRDPKNKFLSEVGAPISKDKVTLPFSMSSLDKVKPDTKALEKWIKKYDGPYLLSDKLDGVSGLIHYKNSKLSLYTRGDGKQGQDISYLIPFIFSDTLRETNFKDDIAIRGELIISKKDFKKVSDQFANARNAVAGLVNSKNFSTEVAKITKFVAYAVVNPRYDQIEQMKLIKKYKFDIVNYDIQTKLTNDYLSEFLKRRRIDSEYDVDGIVVIDSSEIHDHIDKNPEYGFAFKTILSDQVAEVVVRNVKWEVSMDGYFKPVVEIEPVKLVGVTISNVTAHNAKFIYENKIGAGSVIEIIRSGDVIPKIEKVLKPSVSKAPQMPDLPYKWNKTKVDIIASDINSDQMKNVRDSIKIKRMVHFFNHIGAMHISEGTIRKLYKTGFTSISKIINSDLSKVSQIEGLGNKSMTKIQKSIKEAIKNTSLSKFMASSHKFGRGFGQRRLKLIIDKYPNILNEKWSESDIIDKITNIDGFDTLTATQFAKNLNEFKKFFTELSKVINLDHLKKVNTKKGVKFSDMTIVFTGFRNKDLEKVIEDNSGKITTSVSNNTSIVVYNDKSQKSSKITKAKSLGVKTMSLEEFKLKYNV